MHWTKTQAGVLPSPYESVSITGSATRRIKLEMVSISCHGPTQAEAFLATLALFVCYAGSSKEEKVFLRLPSVWRDLWAEMMQIQKAKDDAADKGTLRKLRGLVASSEHCFPETFPSKNVTDAEEMKRALVQQPEQDSISAEQLRARWSDKSSSIAYQAMLKSRRTLPIWDYRQEILEAIGAHQIVIVCGATGCGKSTQVPAYLLENEMSSGRACKIYCTEPRRISAISLARRVSAELGESKIEVGTSRSLVGFAIRLESKVTVQTRLVYATTGIVMRMLEGSQSLEGITHLILDEVHERMSKGLPLRQARR